MLFTLCIIIYFILLLNINISIYDLFQWIYDQIIAQLCIRLPVQRKALLNDLQNVSELLF